MNMGIGPFIRSMFGPYERWISEAYRSFYIDIDGFTERVREWAPTAKRILEVGCGDGAVTERLKANYPYAKITAIDITARVGRLYRGPLDGVRFMQCTVQEIAATEAGHYDLVVLCDVLHHVPVEFRQDLLDAIRGTLTPGGVLIFKDWVRNFALIHMLCHASDRWLTGDRVSYMTRDQMHEGITRSFGETAVVDETRVVPWRNNIAMLVRR